MRTDNELKQLLTQIKDNDYSLPAEIDMESIIADMLKYVGHTDGELRDGLIYSTFGEWADRGTISPTQMKHVLDTSLKESHLFFGVGERGTDSVFTRAFSSLLVALTLAMHDEAPFLMDKDIREIKEVVMRYVGMEKDYRGYVDGKGWAHAVAHIADALFNIAGCGKAVDIEGEYNIGRDGLLEVLEAVKLLICNNEFVYQAEEDERLAAACMVVIWRKILTNEDIINWIDSFELKKMNWGGSIPGDYYLRVNKKHFIRSLYFKLLADGNYEEICTHILGLLLEKED
ncbi:MAG: DUF2785 domain-containing protein [Defluviitaleaceae bacterium]|nr:DUF2785 domain-containing protein [Defluviitaleaceae bacterium]